VIKLKPILEIQLIKEALPLATARKYVSMNRNPQIEQRMDAMLSALAALPDTKSSRRMDRVGVPYETKEVAIDISKLSDKYSEFWYAMRDILHKSDRIEGKVDDNGNETTLMPQYEDIFRDMVTDSYGRKTKVSKWITGLITKTEIQYKLKTLEKYIQKDEKGRETLAGQRPMEDVRKQLKDEARKRIEDLIAKYNEIPEVKLYRENKIKTFYIIFSKHKYDVAGMSTGRGWTSCMNVYDGVNSQYIQHDVEAGTMIAYLVRNDDLNIKNPVARVAIKPFVSINDPDSVYYQAEQRAYGSPPAGFLDEINRLVDKVQPDKRGMFRLVDTLYCDTGDRNITKFSDPQIEQKVANLLKQGRLAQTVDEVEYILTKYSYANQPQYFEGMEFNEADKLYVNAPWLPVTYKVEIPYSPIAFQTIFSFSITIQRDATTFDNFPQQCQKLIVKNMDFDSCETLDTIVTNRIDLDRCGIGSFKGLKAGPTQLQINNSTVKSFEGLPTTVYELTTNSSTKLEMSLSKFIETLKHVNLRGLYLGGYETAYELDRSARNGHGLAKDIQRLMKEKDPNWDGTDINGGNHLYKQILLNILTELPSLSTLFSHNIQSLEYDIKRYEAKR
jgi:hypothetical protein